MKSAETRPSSPSGVTVWRSVIWLIVQSSGPAPKRKKAAPARIAEGAQMVATMQAAAATDTTGPALIAVPKDHRRITPGARIAPVSMPAP